MKTTEQRPGRIEPIVSDTPRTTELHCSIPMDGMFGVADAYNSMRRHAETLELESDRLRTAIQQTLDENGHLADGEICTLILLKQALNKR